MKTVIYSFNYSLDYLVEQLADVSEAAMTVQPGGLLNHPSWTIGHLTFVLHMIGGVVGVRSCLPETFPRLFGPGSTPENDRGSYDSKDEAIRRLRELQFLVTEAISKVEDDFLDQRFPDEAYLEVFPTIRHALAQVLIGHTAFHVGQISMWRRAMGLRPMARSYE